jgi:hypothetical protein
LLGLLGRKGINFMNRRKIISVLNADNKDLMALCDKRINEMASMLRREVVLPFCKKHNLTFENGNGSWNFADKNGCWYVLDNKAINDILNFSYNFNGISIGCYIEPVTKQDIYDDVERLRKILKW